jgi:hypothetical protein
MRQLVIAGAITLAAIIARPSSSHGGAPSDLADKATSTSPAVQSGIYGYSGGRSDIASDPEGVVGECIWVYDAMDKRQVAKGECSERRPGNFRVVLKPGRYVVHGPGGNQKVEIKQGEWVKISSIVRLPLGP